MVVLVRLPVQRWRRLGIDVLAAVVGAALSFLVFWLAGLRVFPGKSWWGTYLEWNSRLDYTVFIGDATIWQRDTALIVVVVALVVSVIATIAQPRHRWAWAALALSFANIALTIALMIVLRGPWLETPTYVAKLWPAALLALVLAITSMAPGTHEGKRLWNPVTVLAGLITVPLLMWSGRFDGVLGYATGWLIGAAMIAGMALSAFLVRTRWNRAVAITLACATAVVFIGAQLLQNGRGLLGSYGQYPFRSAFVDFNFDDQFASKMQAQEWLLERTSRDDSIALWTDVDRLGADVAAMQLWGGYNLVTPDAALTRDTTQRLEQMRPSVVAMYAPDRALIDTFAESLPAWSLPSELECTSVPYLGVGTGEVIVCITRLTWVG